MHLSGFNSDMPRLTGSPLITNKVCLILFLLFSFNSTTSVAQEVETETVSTETLTSAQQSFDNADPSSAFTLLKPYSDSMAGEVEFDYLFGRSALAIQDYRTAISAFMRILALDPGFSAARIELARTYYAQGIKEFSRSSLEQSRAEFLNVRLQKPPAEISRVIDAYLDSIQRHLDVKTLEYSSAVEVGLGYDSNANSAPSIDQFSFFDSSLPGVRNYKLPLFSRERDYYFSEVNLLAGMLMPFRSIDMDFFARFNGMARTYTHYPTTNKSATGFGVQLGLRHYGKSNRKSLTFNPSHIRIDGRYYSDNFNFNLLWEQELNDTNKMNFSFNKGNNHYSYPLWPLSVDYERLAIEWSHLHGDVDKSNSQLLIMFGNDHDPHCDTGTCTSPYTRKAPGLRYSYSTQTNAQTRLYTSIFIQTSGYRDPFFEQTRKDERTELYLALEKNISKTLSYRPSLQYISNDSTIDLYDIKRLVAAAHLRWEY